LTAVRTARFRCRLSGGAVPSSVLLAASATTLVFLLTATIISTSAATAAIVTVATAAVISTLTASATAIATLTAASVFTVLSTLATAETDVGTAGERDRERAGRQRERSSSGQSFFPVFLGHATGRRSAGS
jgi:hypothetical protein